MSATEADPPAESTRFGGQSHAWELTRTAFRAGRKAGSSLYLISVGLTASWVIAVFFGIGLFFLVPRPVKLASGSAGGSSSVTTPAAESSWLLQSTNKLDRLSMAPAARSSQPKDAAALENARAIREPAGQDTIELNRRSALPDPESANTVEAPPDQVLRPARVTGATMNVATPESSAEETPGPGLSPHTLSSRKKQSQKPASGRGPMPRPPTQAIQDVLQRHSQLLK
jgi:hypothetical protein